MTSLFLALHALRSDRKGVSTIEYAVLAFAIVAIVGIILATLGGQLNGLFGGLGNAINNAVNTATTLPSGN